MAAIRVELECTLTAPPERVWDAIQRPALLHHISAPVLAFDPIAPAHWPAQWSPGRYRAGLRLFGVLPVGWQVIDISFPQPGAQVIRDNGHRPMIARWDHWITLAECAGGTRYTDRVDIDAGWLTRPVAAFARALYKHRQKRLSALAQINFKGILPGA